MTGTEPAPSAERARALLALGRVGDAEQVLRAGLAARPGDAQLLHLLASCLHELGDLPAALEAGQASVAAAPDNVEALSTLAAVQIANGKRAHALRTVDHAVALAPFFGDLHRQRAQVLHANGKRADALGAARHARQLAPEDVGVATALAELLLAAGDIDGARVEVERALALDPQDTEAHRLRGLLSLRARDSAASIHGYREALRLDPGNSRARAGLTTALKSRNRMFRAVLAFSFWVQHLPPGMRAAVGAAPFVLGRVLFVLGDGPVVLTLDVLLVAWVALIFGIHPFMDVVLLSSRDDRPLMTGREKASAATFLLFAVPALAAATLAVAGRHEVIVLALGLAGCTVFGPQAVMLRRRWAKAVGLAALAVAWVAGVLGVVLIALGVVSQAVLASALVALGLVVALLVSWAR